MIIYYQDKKGYYHFYKDVYTPGNELILCDVMRGSQSLVQELKAERIMARLESGLNCVHVIDCDTDTIYKTCNNKSEAERVLQNFIQDKNNNQQYDY